MNIATWNITSGRGARLNGALRALWKMGTVDLCFLTEAKITDGVYTRHAFSYDVVATHAMSAQRGGVALAYRSSPYWQVESTQCHGPNVISCVLVSGRQRTPLIGVYIPPSDETTIEHLERALHRFQGGQAPIILGDLNTELRAPRDAREQRIATLMADAGVSNMLPHFQFPGRHAGQYTWRKYSADGKSVLNQARCDYILGRDRRRFRSIRLKDPPTYSTDHLMVVGQLMSKPLGANRSYLRKRQRYPLPAPTVGPDSPLVDRLFQELKEAMPRPTRPTRRRNAWISDATWRLIDQKSAMRRRHGVGYSPAALRRLSRRIASSLRADRKRRVEEAGAAVEDAMGANDHKGAWELARAWYRQAEDRPPKPSHQELATVSEEYANLYTESTPHGEPVPVIVAPFDVPDTVPNEAEIAEAVRRLRRGKAPGPSGLTADQLKDWLVAAEREENPDPKYWNILVQLVQQVFDTGELPEDMARSTMILLPKGGGQFRGIGLLESVWKVISSVLNRRLQASIELHDALHGFRARRGTGTAIIEAKLLQQWARLKQVPLYGIFLDLRKAYDTLDRERALGILEGYGVGPRCLGLLRRFWAQQQVVAKQAGYYGDPFGATRGVTQGDIVSPVIFNIVADAVIRYWLASVTEVPVESIDGVGFNVTARAALFYADDGYLASPDKKWLQDAVEVLVELFSRVGLRTNTEKTKAMICLPGAIRTYYSEAAYKRKLEGHGETYSQRKRRRIDCVECGRDLAVGSVTSHMRSQHGMEPVPPGPAAPLSHTHYADVYRQTRRHPITCPVPDCIYSARSENLLRRHFATRHPGDTFQVRGEIFNAPCERCGMQVAPNNLARGHRFSELCDMLAQERAQARVIRVCQEAQTTVFSALGEELEMVRDFRYLGRPLSELDSDMPAFRHNLRKARQKWGMLSRLLVREGATPLVSGKFYKAVVQAVLLYGSETWVWTESMRLAFQGFHHRVARRLTGMTARLQNGVWVYPPIEEALEAAGLRTIDVYIARRRRRMQAQVEERPIYRICQETPRLPGTPTTLGLWWEQFIEVDNNP